jgi:L-methionine (R)-S-oxide reductase
MAKMPGATLSVTAYLEKSGLSTQFVDISAKVLSYQQQLQQYLSSAPAAAVKWHYQVPELGEGGACSLFGHLAEAPYQLESILGGKTEANQQALQQLSNIVAFYQQHSGLDWFGIYQARDNGAAQPVLVKLAYYGAPSRAEFPLTAEFAKISNNSTVGLSGRAKVINDVAAYLGQGGEYYTCDPKVQAEACLPLFDQSGKITGIVDAEDFNKNVFNADAMALLLAVCLTIPAYLP